VTLTSSASTDVLHDVITSDDTRRAIAAAIRRADQNRLLVGHDLEHVAGTVQAELADFLDTQLEFLVTGALTASRARLAAMNDAAAKLKVRQVCVCGDAYLLVDAEDLTSSPHEVQTWLLEHDGASTWSHAASGTSSPLYEMLRGIAATYINVDAQAEAGQ
jgi:hypothetical protein